MPCKCGSYAINFPNIQNQPGKLCDVCLFSEALADVVNGLHQKGLVSNVAELANVIGVPHDKAEQILRVCVLGNERIAHYTQTEQKQRNESPSVLPKIRKPSVRSHKPPTV